jgi:hypothetical protein
MATRETTAQLTAKFGDFKPTVGTTGSTLYILEKRSNHLESMSLLDKAGLVPFERQEILPLLMKDEGLKNVLKGKWFYLVGKGLKKEGIYTVNSNGELVEIRDKELSIEMKVRAWSGPNPLSLFVLSDCDATYCGWRFYLFAYYDPSDVALVVVGKPKLSLSKPVSALISEIETAAENLRRSANQEDLGERVNELQEKAAALKRMLRPT